MRPVNLIPVDQRRGGAGGSGQGMDIGVYAVLGGLAVAVVMVLALVMTSNSLTSKKDKLAEVQAQSQGEKQVADALRPYSQFADLQRARYQQIVSLTSDRFDWERALNQLSLAIPRNVYLLNVAATLSPNVEIEGGGGSGALTSFREKTQAPAFVMTGCTYSQHAVARMMTRMRNLDEVTNVRLAKSERKEADSSASPAPATGTGETTDIQDCLGSRRVTKFDLLVEFGGATPDATAAAAAGGVPPGSAAPIAAAQGAVQQSGAAATSAGGTQ